MYKKHKMLCIKTTSGKYRYLVLKSQGQKGQTDSVNETNCAIFVSFFKFFWLFLQTVVMSLPTQACNSSQRKLYKCEWWSLCKETPFSQSLFPPPTDCHIVHPG